MVLPPIKVQSEMLIYISLVNYAESGLRDIKKSPERLAAARKEAEELSGKVDKVYLPIGSRPDYNRGFTRRCNRSNLRISP